MGKRATHAGEQFLLFERFAHVLEGAATQNVGILPPVAKRRDHHDRQIGKDSFQRVQQRGSFHLWHRYVGDDQIESFPGILEIIQRTDGIGFVDHSVPRKSQDLGQRLEQFYVVVHDENRCGLCTRFTHGGRFSRGGATSDRSSECLASSGVAGIGPYEANGHAVGKERLNPTDWPCSGGALSDGDAVYVEANTTTSALLTASPKIAVAKFARRHQASWPLSPSLPHSV